jgi:exodeoxyribonuclease VII large subunit
LNGPHPTDLPVAAIAEPGASAATAVSVATVNQALKDIVEGAFLPLWVRGEVSDFKRHRNGHWYFTLRDSKSQLSCVAWSRDQRRIPAAPDEGMQLNAYGQLSVYAARGDVQFSVWKLEADGDGLRRKALEQIRARLEEDGLLAPERKRPLPQSPGCIAVITSTEGAALHDIVYVVRRRCPSVNLVVVPARVQGDGAAEELRKALGKVYRWRGADVLIIGRGGGAREDLWSFNDERLARTLAASPIPTISAVGHEVDFSICDLVADHRSATPSAAAEAAVPSVADLRTRLSARADRVRRGMLLAVRNRSDRLTRVTHVIPVSMARLAQNRAARLHSLAARVGDLSPLSVMARGYAVARHADGRTMGSAADFTPGERFSLLLKDGSVEALAQDVSLKREDERDGV